MPGSHNNPQLLPPPPPSLPVSPTPLWFPFFPPDSHLYLLLSSCFSPPLPVIFHTVRRSSLGTQGLCLSRGSKLPRQEREKSERRIPPPSLTAGSPEVLMASLRATLQCTVGADLWKRKHEETIDYCESIKPCVKFI